jgi:heptaprenyl diphosphate synthase
VFVTRRYQDDCLGFTGLEPSPIVLWMNAVEILGLGGLDQELRRVEPLLVSSVSAGDPFLDQVATHLIQAGGKRLRPMLALASATRGTRRATQEDLLGSVSVELVHLASLYHDDVIDEATIRRGTDSVNSRFGNLMAIVGGDYLLARAAEIAASLGTEIAGLLATTLGRLCQGQVSEVKTVCSVARTTEQYFEAIAGKTAALMATSCRIGALTGQASRDEVEALTAFGTNFGMVFQLRDDVLDVVAADGELGKPPGQDLAEGVYTLPVLHALADPEIGPELSTLLGQPLALPERDKAQAMVANSSGITATIAVGRQFAAKANQALAGVVSTELSHALGSLTESLFDDLPG